MRKSQTDGTTAQNLEAKFERGEDVLDYFDAKTARLVRPPAPAAASQNKKATSSYPGKSSSREKAIGGRRAKM